MGAAPTFVPPIQAPEALRKTSSIRSPERRSMDGVTCEQKLAVVAMLAWPRTRETV